MPRGAVPHPASRIPHRPPVRRLLSALPLLLAACATPRREPVYLGVDPRRPYAEAVRAGDLLFVAGKLGTDSTGRLVAGGIAAETRQALVNVRAALERHGAGMDRVVKCTCFLADIGEWQAMTDAYVGAFPAERRPARTALAVGGLPLGGRVEIECVAMAR
jgi:lysine/arginine/ornithine transport system substrate-binding protein